MSKKSALLSCLVLFVAGTLRAQSADYWRPVAPQFTVKIAPQANHYVRDLLDNLGITDEFTFTQANAAAYALADDYNEDGIPDHLRLNFDDPPSGENFPWTFINIASHHTAGENLVSGQTYTDASRDHIFDDAGNVVNTAFNHTECDDVGSFTLTSFTYERRDVGIIEPSWEFHVTGVTLRSVTACETDDATVTMDVSYTDTAKGGDTGGGDDGGGSPEPPPPPPFQVVLPTNLGIEPVVMANAATQKVKFTTAIDSTFNSDVALWVETTSAEGSGFTASIEPAFIAAPGIGEGEITINTASMTRPGTYDVTVYAQSGETVSTSTFRVLLDCTPPTILGIHQPQSLSVDNGESITIETTPSGSGPFLYQWYRGERGMTNDPVLSANESKLILAAREPARYWVRVSNACGTFDSNSATVNVTGTLAGPVKRRTRH